MKQIQSAGGPLIGLDRDHLHLWTGVFGKEFIGKASPFRTDYEAAGYLTDGRNHPPRNVASITGLTATGLLITVPDYTAVLPIDGEAVYIAQVEYCDPEWDFHLIFRDDFEKASFDPKKHISFSCKSCTYALFDAAYAGCDVGDDCLTFSLDAGEYVFSSALYEPDDRTGLILYKITRKGYAVL